MATVFHAPKPPATLHPRSWAPLDHLHEDDELVYPVRTGSPVPTLRFLHSLGRKSLKFEMLVRSVYCVCMTDSGATHSFMSLRFAKANSLKFARVHSSALLADGKTQLPVVGVMWNSQVKIDRFSCLQSFLVLDIEDCDVVLGMDWLDEHDPTISFKKRKMTLSAAKGPITVHAMSSEPHPECESSRFELCTLDAFARSLRDESAVELKDAVVAVLQHTPECSSALGADMKESEPLLLEFADVLVSEIPGGLPPERVGPDGRPIECVIEVDPNEKPFAHHLQFRNLEQSS